MSEQTLARYCEIRPERERPRFVCAAAPARVVQHGGKAIAVCRAHAAGLGIRWPS